jgi:hypothetical protein
MLPKNEIKIAAGAKKIVASIIMHHDFMLIKISNIFSA